MYIVILGGGFGGMHVLKRLSNVFAERDDVHITLIDRQHYFTFSLLLHEVATGAMDSRALQVRLASFTRKNVDIRREEVRLLSLAERYVETATEKIYYDRLLVSLGAESNFFNTPGAEDYSYTLKSLHDALRLKEQVITAVKTASHTPAEAERKKLLRVLIVGGGPTGVELAAELAEWMRGHLGPKYLTPSQQEGIEIMMLQRGDRLLPQFSSFLQQASYRALEKKRVIVRFGATVTAIENGSVVLADGEVIPSHTIIWVAGVRPNILGVDDKETREPGSGKLIVESTLQLKGHADVFVIGDMALHRNQETETAAPALALVAIREAVTAARNIRRSIEGKPLQRFVYHHPGEIVSLGKWNAAGELYRIFFSGMMAWFLWRTIYLCRFFSLANNRGITMRLWLRSYVSRRDG